MLDNASDGELVSMYVIDHNESAIRALVTRHHDRLYSRFLAELKNEADAKDLEQQLWLQVVRNLSSYKDEGKFAHFLSRIASNLINDFWRSKGRRSKVFVENREQNDQTSSQESDGGESFDSEHYGDPGPDEHERFENEELLRYLVTVLIPQVPVEQRTVWLLRHESEYWEEGRRLDWNHMAELNGTEPQEIWQTFETARSKLMKMTIAKSEKPSELTDEELLAFVVWTQAQRLDKGQQYTWEYFSDLLGVPTNTMKTRYRAAQKFLSDGLEARLKE